MSMDELSICCPSGASLFRASSSARRMVILNIQSMQLVTATLTQVRSVVHICVCHKLSGKSVIQSIGVVLLLQSIAYPKMCEGRKNLVV